MTWNGANFVQSCGRSSAMRRVNCRVESSGITGIKETASGPNITPEVATQTPSLGGQPIPLATYEPSAEISEGIGRSQVTLRQWLSRLGRPVDRVESLHIFKQVLEFVELAHAQGVILRTIRPSCLLLSPLNRVTFIDSTSSRSSSDHSGNHSCRNESPDLEARVTDGVQERSQAQSVVNQSATATGSSVQNTGLNSTQQVNSQQEGEWDGSSASDWCGPNTTRGRMGIGAHSSETDSSSAKRSDAGDDTSVRLDECFPQRQVLLMEQTWYTSPEELENMSTTFASDIYSLGVLIFELFCTFGSEGERARVMADLRHRILPPRLLSERPKEASFCLWLLHPDPSCRPKARELLLCDMLCEAEEAIEARQAAVYLEEKEGEAEVLLEFLLHMENQKQASVHTLTQQISRLSSDIEEIEKRQSLLKRKRSLATMEKMDKPKGGRTERRGLLGKRSQPEGRVEEREKGIVCTDRRERWPDKVSSSSKSTRLMNNFNHLERVYFAMDWRFGNPGMDATRASSSSMSIGSAFDEQKESSSQKSGGNEEDWLGCFFDSLCKYARYSRFEVKATLRHGDLLNTANMVCSLSFDRDEEFFATAGVCKRIKVFECDTVLNEHVDIHYPVVEMACRSKLSSVCWNGYIKSHLASCDYEGVVQLWDASTSQVLMEYEEHEKRAWSVDFSRADPTKLASGSDDGTVKLWSINQESSIGTIKTKANVCCIQFPPDSGHLLTFGSADYKIYCYDLRTTRQPLCILASHNKAVSYVKFVDPTTLVSASTDNTLKLWDLKRANMTPNALTMCSLTYTGHTNEKNFIGLSIADGYIACGSETNAVFAYHKSLPMEMASHKFGCTDPVTGQEIEEDGGQFVSSVCWRGKSQTLVAANSMGNIKILEMV